MTVLIKIIAGDKRYIKYPAPVMDVDEGPIRCLILQEAAYAMIDLEHGTLDDRRRVAINKQLSAFVAGSLLTVIGAPYPKGTRSKKPSEVRGLQKFDFVLWELKFRHPTNYRLIGVVPEKDTFVGISMASRQAIDWDTTCAEVYKDYVTLLNGAPCSAIKTYEPNKAFSRLRIPK